MRKLLIVLAGAALTVGLAAPVWADGKSSRPADRPITAMGEHGHGHGDHDAATVTTTDGCAATVTTTDGRRPP